MMTSTGENSAQSSGVFLFNVTDGKFQSGGTSAVIVGEVELAITQNNPDGEAVQLVHLSLFSPRLVSWRGSTGELSITARLGQGQVRDGRLELSLQAEIQYTERTESGYTMLAEVASTTAVFPKIPVESFDGTLEGILDPPGIDGIRVLQDATLRLSSGKGREANASPTPGVTMEAAGLDEGGEDVAGERLSLTLSAAAKAVTPITGCPPDRQAMVRTLTIQPVFFSGDATHPLRTGATFDQQATTARTIWGQCGINFDVQVAIVLADTNASRSGNFNTVVSSLPLSQRRGDAAHVFVVENHLPPGDGGGLQFGSDIVLTDANDGNPTLLAHELGHLFGLVHQAGNIMQPSGNPQMPSPSNNALQLCQRITLAKLKTGGSFCITAP